MQNDKSQTPSDEISSKDTVGFLRRNGKAVLLWGLSGLVVAGAYVAIAPSKFEARWELQMAQFVTAGTSAGIEDPAALIQRLRSPTAYPVEVRSRCAMPETGEFHDYLDGKLEINAAKTAANVVEMKVHAASPGQARQCAEAIVAMIVAQQHDLIDVRLAGHRAQLLKYQQALAQLDQQLEKIKKPEAIGFVFLSNYENLAWLRIKIADLEGDISQSHLHPAQLIAPIYAPSTPAAPKMKLALLLGGVLGLMAGLLYASGRGGWRKAS